MLAIVELWKHLEAKRKSSIYLLLILLILSSIAEIISIGSIVPLLTAIFTPASAIQGQSILYNILSLLHINSHNNSLLIISIFFVMFSIISAILRVYLLYSQTHLCHQIGSDIACKIFFNVLHKPYSFYIKHNSSEIIANIVTKSNHLVYSALLPGITLIISSVLTFSILAVLICLNPLIAFGCFFSFSALYGFFIYFIRRKLESSGNLIANQSANSVKIIQESLGGIRDILLDGVQIHAYNSFRNTDSTLKKAYASLFILNNTPRFIVEAFGITLIVFILYFFSGETETFSSSLPMIGALALAAQRLVPLLQQAYSSWASIGGFQASLRDILDALNVAELPVRIPAHKLKKGLSFQKEICVKNLSFRYENSSNFSLANINFKISKGEKIGFIGHTGSGKSTLLDIIMGLLEPTNGGLYIDGVKITNKNSALWQKRIAHVPQNIFLCDGSIAENIAFGVPKEDIDLEKVANITELVGLGNEIDKMSGRINTIVGERGVRLSGGQRQRIGIARALYKGADVLVLDEATSSLDSKTEAKIIQSIESVSANMTVLIIAHRISTLKNCTRIVQLENGLIINISRYEEL